MRTVVICVELVILSVFLVAVSDVRGGCKSQHSCGPCRRHWDPVCGSNGKTYSNSCIFACVRNNCNPGLEIAYDGECGGTDSKENVAEQLEDIDDDASGSSEEDDEEDDEDEDEDDRRRISLRALLRI